MTAQAHEGGARCRRQRCPECRAGAAAYERHKYRQIAYGRWQPYVDAGPVREHVLMLRSYGVGSIRIARAAGVPQHVVRNLLWGKTDRGPSRQIRPENADRLLAVRPSPALFESRTLADATGTRRRLQALIATGHCRISLAGRLGMQPSNLYRIIRDERWVFRATATAVSSLYDDLWDTPPDESTPAAARRAARARAEGLAAGWPPPLAWDDGSIGDPAAGPAEGWQRHDGKLRDSAALAEDATELIEGQGYDRVTAAERLKVSRHALDKAFSRTAAAGRRSDAA